MRRYPLLSGGASLAQRQPFRRLTPAGEIVEATLRDGGRLLVEPGSFIGRSVLLTGDYDPKLTRVCEATLRPGDVVLDVGANLGVVSAYAARLVGPQGRVHAFEPQPELVRLMERSMRLNDYAQVTVHEMALSDHDGVAPLYGATARRESASLHGRGSTIGEVQVRDASAVLHSLDLGPIRLLKLDVEGHEEAVLRGAQPYLRRNTPEVVLFESHGDSPFRSRPVVRLLGELGFEFFQVPKALRALRLVPLPGDETARGFDFVALRRGSDLIPRLT